MRLTYSIRRASQNKLRRFGQSDYRYGWRELKGSHGTEYVSLGKSNPPASNSGAHTTYLRGGGMSKHAFESNLHDGLIIQSSSYRDRGPRSKSVNYLG